MSALLRSTAVLLSLIGLDAVGQTVLQRTRLGNDTEDIAYVSSGRYAQHVVIIDGFDVYAVPRKAGSDHAIRKLFEMRGLPLEAAPRGITYLPEEKAFVLNDLATPRRFLLVGADGTYLGERTYRYLDGFEPFSVEGVDTIPANETNFPGHLAFLVMDPDIVSWLEIARPDGEVVKHITLPEELANDQPFGVTALGGGRLLISSTRRLWTIDYDGQLLSEPVTIETPDYIEGVVATERGEVAFADHSSGKLQFLDASLSPLPGRTLNYGIGLGFRGPNNVAWNPVTGKFVLSDLNPGEAATTVYQVPTTLDSKEPWFDTTALGVRSLGGMAWIDSEQRLAATSTTRPRGVLFYGADGSYQSRFNFRFELGRSLAYARSTGELLIADLFADDSSITLNRYALDGTLLGSLNFANEGLGSGVMGVAYFERGGEGRVLVLTGRGAAVVDLLGTVEQVLDIRGMVGGNANQLVAITTGPWAGNFATIATNTSELVIFSLD